VGTAGHEPLAFILPHFLPRRNCSGWPAGLVSASDRPEVPRQYER
jgi:hypothetical protein